MSLGGTSPTTTAASESSNGPVSNQDFARYIKYFQDTHNIIRKWDHALADAPPSGITVKTPDGDKVMDKRSLSRYSKDYINQLGDLKKIYANRKKKSSRTSTQFSSLFYVSDQLAAFYKNANLGPIDPDSGDGKLSDMIDIVTKKRMANAGILTSLFSRYISVNGLAASSGGRFVPDERMKKAFSTTNFRMNSKDLSRRKCAPGTPSEKEEAIREKIALGKKGALERAQEKIDKRGERMYEPKKGLLWTSMMTINSYFRIPNQLLTDEEREELKDPENVQAAKELQEVITQIKNHMKQQ